MMLNITSSEGESPEENAGPNEVTTGTVSYYGGWMISSKGNCHR